jgi:hypothetical protein
MALTMTRTRTQTALTQLVETVANLKGELAFVEDWLAEPGAPAGLGVRREVLLGQLEALTTTLRVFDPGLDLSQVASAAGWARSHGQMKLRAKEMRRRYFNAHSGK